MTSHVTRRHLRWWFQMGCATCFSPLSDSWLPTRQQREREWFTWVEHETCEHLGGGDCVNETWNIYHLYVRSRCLHKLQNLMYIISCFGIRWQKVKSSANRITELRIYWFGGFRTTCILGVQLHWRPQNHAILGVQRKHWSECLLHWTFCPRECLKTTGPKNSFIHSLTMMLCNRYMTSRY